MPLSAEKIITRLANQNAEGIIRFYEDYTTRTVPFLLTLLTAILKSVRLLSIAESSEAEPIWNNCLEEQQIAFDSKHTKFLRKSNLASFSSVFGYFLFVHTIDVSNSDTERAYERIRMGVCYQSLHCTQLWLTKKIAAIPNPCLAIDSDLLSEILGIALATTDSHKAAGYILFVNTCFGLMQKISDKEMRNDLMVRLMVALNQAKKLFSESTNEIHNLYFGNEEKIAKDFRFFKRFLEEHTPNASCHNRLNYGSR